MKINTYSFKKAAPVWEVGTQTVMNRTLTFRTEINLSDEKGYKLALAASSIFIVTVNGKFVAYGPARAGHGYYRVDEIDLDKYLTKGKNIVTVRVSSYNVNSYCYLDQPAFLCAELSLGDNVIAFTDTDASCGFVAYPMEERVMKVQRITFQRTFTETYRLKNGAFAPEQADDVDMAPVKLEYTDKKNFICRDIPYGDYEVLLPTKTLRRGNVSFDGKPYYHDRCLVPSPVYKTYALDELEYNSHNDIDSFAFFNVKDTNEATDCMSIDADSFIDVKFECDYAGIFEFDLETDGGNFYILFTDLETDGNISPRRMGDCSQFATFLCEKGTYHICCTEPNTFSCARFVAKSGACKISNFRANKIAFPYSKINARFKGDDKQLEKIYNAAIETFVSNTTDEYMDCPSRERAGWLCDSFFTSRVEKTLTGKSEVERAFLENFLLPEKFAGLPDGMLPMCYPGDHPDGNFIPNWAMWYVLELEEYLERSGDRSLIDGAKDRVYALLNYFKKFENEFGLLEKLEAWVFVEWSKANDLVQDVNFPSNMLYARFKRAIARLYGDAQMDSEAEALEKLIPTMCYRGGFFCDNAIREDDGVLKLSGMCTEACQYYAFFCNIATPATFPELWDTLVKDFSYKRKTDNKYPEIFFANAFIGNYLRLDLLDRYGYGEQLLDNIRGYFTYMADATGTLWENDTACASVNHGFASHVAYWLDRLGYVEHL